MRTERISSQNKLKDFYRLNNCNKEHTKNVKVSKKRDCNLKDKISKRKNQQFSSCIMEENIFHKNFKIGVTAVTMHMITKPKTLQIMTSNLLSSVPKCVLIRSPNSISFNCRKIRMWTETIIISRLEKDFHIILF